MANRLRAGAVATDYASTRHAQTFCFYYLHCLHKLGNFAKSLTPTFSLPQPLVRPCSGLREFAEALEEEVQHRHSTAVAARANHAAHHAERRARDVRDNAEAETLRRLDADREAEEQRHNRRRSPRVADAVAAIAMRGRRLHQDDLAQVLEHGVRGKLRQQVVRERLLLHVAVREQVLLVTSRLERMPLAVNFRLSRDSSFLKCWHDQNLLQVPRSVRA